MRCPPRPRPRLMLRPDYRLAAVIAAMVWGLIGALLLAGAVNPALDADPLDLEGPPLLLGAAGVALVLAALLNALTLVPLHFESTKWRLLITSDMARITGLCLMAYAALSGPNVALGWALLGVGFSVVAAARMWVLWLFFRRVRHQRSLLEDD